MILEKPQVFIEPYDPLKIMRNIERAMRTCYRSEGAMTEDSYKRLLGMAITSGHESVMEHEKITVPEIVLPEAVIAPMDQTVECATNIEGQEQPIYNEQPSNKGMFKRPFSFHGRIRRSEYGFSVLLFYLYAIVAGFVLGLITNGNFSEGAIYVCLIPGYWFLWAQGAKRCHDRNNTGWYQIIPFYALWMLFADGDEGENDYGDNPKCK